MNSPSPARAPHPPLASRVLLNLILIAFTTSGSSILEASPPDGQLLSSQCFQCHGTNGQAVDGFESIAGKSSNEMYKELLEMSRRRPETIMDLQARAFTPEQLKLIADYLATLRPEKSDDSEDDR